MPVHETPSEVELLDTEIEDVEGDVDAVHFCLDEPTTLNVGEVAGHPLEVTAQHFIAASLETEIEDDMRRQMLGEEEIDEASIFISDEEGTFENEAGLFRLEGADIDGVISEFVEEYLSTDE